MSAQSHGSVGEEAGRLFDALQQAAVAWLRGTGSGGMGSSGAGSSRADSSGAGPERARGVDGHTPETCGICPVCQAISRLGQARPEVVGHLADATAALAAAFSALAGEQADHRADRGDRDATTRPTTEHIDVTD